MASDRLHDPRKMFRLERSARMREQANGWGRMIWNEDDADRLTLMRLLLVYAKGLHVAASPLLKLPPELRI